MVSAEGEHLVKDSWAMTMAVAVVIVFLLVIAFVVHRLAGAAAPNRLARPLYALAAVLGTVSTVVYALAEFR